MFRTTDYKKIADAVIKFVSVFMVDKFRWFKFSFKMFLHNITILSRWFSVYHYNPIPIRAYCSPCAIMRIKTFKRAISSLVSTPIFSCLCKELLTTTFTIPVFTLQWSYHMNIFRKAFLRTDTHFFCLLRSNISVKFFSTNPTYKWSTKNSPVSIFLVSNKHLQIIPQFIWEQKEEEHYGT